MTDNTFMANLEQEDTKAFPVRTEEEEKETPPEPPAEKEPKEDETPSSGGEKGKDESPGPKKDANPEVFHAFHKHPKWLATQNELKELRAFREKAEPLLEQLGKAPEKREEKTEIPAWFVDLFGENQDAWVKYRTHTAAERKQLHEEIMSELQEQSRQASEETKKWDKWVDTELSSVLDDDEIKARAKAVGFDFSNKDHVKMFRNELLKVALDYQPSDGDNNVSLRKAFDILELQKLRKQPEKAPADRKKEVADRTMQKDNSNANKKDYKTSFDLAGKSFRDLVSVEE